MTIALTPTYPTGATTTFLSMVTDISPHVIGCPDYVMAQAVLATARELCERARVWRARTVPVTLAAGVYSYTVMPAASEAEIVSENTVYAIVNGARHDLSPLAFDEMHRRYPGWPDLDTGSDTPEVYTAVDNQTLQLAPIPDTAGVLYVVASMRPTLTATAWDTGMYSEHKRALFHGALYNLQAMPNRTWTDLKSSVAHGKSWNFLLNAARIRADRSYNRSSTAVRMKPLA